MAENRKRGEKSMTGIHSSQFILLGYMKLKKWTIQIITCFSRMMIYFYSLSFYFFFSYSSIEERISNTSTSPAIFARCRLGDGRECFRLEMCWMNSFFLFSKRCVWTRLIDGGIFIYSRGFREFRIRIERRNIFDFLIVEELKHQNFARE